MYYVTACIKVNEPFTFEEGLNAIKELEEVTNTEEKCVYFHAHPIENRQIMLWEIWQDKQALSAHHEMEHTKRCQNIGYTSVVWIIENEVK